MTLETDPFAGMGAARILTKMRKGFLWGGIVMIVLGMGAVLMPLFSSLVVELLIGWLLTISGGVAVVGAFSFRGTGLFVWELISGLITLAAGLLMLVYPVQGLIALTVLVAVVLVLTGAAQMAFAFWVRPIQGWVWGLVSAIVSIVLGGYIFAALPEASAVILGLLVGIDFISTGVALVLIARTAPPTLEV
ncbi:HdeD family acid-resistance protein [Sulfitobacter sp.]|jgi:uncharacterized membrane protein HdeD (DUF308 family)|uniref:HdeD family acid-resistance protein n=1 Tax=Sulfitobacter sp. TaxID=1903071 RepID=UPI003EF27E82